VLYSFDYNAAEKEVRNQITRGFCTKLIFGKEPIDEIIDIYLKYIVDDKPTARQCIKVLPLIAKYKPDLKQDIDNALQCTIPTRYKESMQSLVMKDIQKALTDIKNL